MQGGTVQATHSRRANELFVLRLASRVWQVLDTLARRATTSLWLALRV